MNINELSANIDAKLLQLEQQLTRLHLQLKQSHGDDEKLKHDINALEKLKFKLKKSRDIAWRAHNLQQDNDNNKLQQKRLIGISLCVFCGMGLVGIALLVLLG